MARSLFRANNNFEMTHCSLIKWKFLKQKKKLFPKSEQYSVRANQTTDTEDRLISVMLNLKLTEISEWDACIEFYALNCIYYVQCSQHVKISI